MTYRLFFRSTIARNMFTELIRSCGCLHQTMIEELEADLLGIVMTPEMEYEKHGTTYHWMSVYTRESSAFFHMSMKLIEELEFVSRISNEAFWELFQSVVPEWEPSAP